MSDRIIKVGLDGELYIGVAGSTAGTEVDTVTNVDISFEKEMTDESSRGSDGWGSKRGTLKYIKIEFDMINKSTDTNFATIRAAAIGDDLLAIYAKDYDSGGGPDADFEVSGFSRGEPLKEGQTIHITCEGNTENRNPTWT